MRLSKVLALVGLVSAAAAGVRAEEVRTVAPGPQFKAGGFHEFLFG